MAFPLAGPCLPSSSNPWQVKLNRPNRPVCCLPLLLQELVELINRRRPMGTPILKHVPLPRLMVGDKGFSE